MKILVAGCGSIGKRHIRNLMSIGGVDVLAYDTSAESRALISEMSGIEVYGDYEDALSSVPDAVVIATPTNSHIEPAFKAAEAGCNLFIEKPVAHTLEGISGLLSEIKKRNLITMVGCNMRFHPGIKKVKELLDESSAGRILSADIETGSYMPEWRPGIDYRKVYSSRSDLGGGVILDSIHEIDYSRWMLGEVAVVSCMADKQSSLEIDVEDTADILLRFTSGVIVHMHLDYVQRPYSRNCKFVGEHGLITWDFNVGQVGLYSAHTKQWTWFKQPVNYELNQMYIDEIKHFINCVKGNEGTTLDIFGGVQDLKIALAAKQSSEEKSFILLVP